MERRAARWPAAGGGRGVSESVRKGVKYTQAATSSARALGAAVRCARGGERATTPGRARVAGAAGGGGGGARGNEVARAVVRWSGRARARALGAAVTCARP